MEEHQIIWLAPVCEKCRDYDERCWCQDEMEPCQECGKRCTRYILDKRYGKRGAQP